MSTLQATTNRQYRLARRPTGSLVKLQSSRTGKPLGRRARRYWRLVVPNWVLLMAVSPSPRS